MSIVSDGRTLPSCRSPAGRNQGIPAWSWAVVPELAVEIVSLTNSADAVAVKLEEYYKAGVILVWVVYPGQSKVYAYTSTTTVRVLAPGDVLDGGDVLPGFRLPVQDLFDKAGQPA